MRFPFLPLLALVAACVSRPAPEASPAKAWKAPSLYGWAEYQGAALHLSAVSGGHGFEYFEAKHRRSGQASWSAPRRFVLSQLAFVPSKGAGAVEMKVRGCQEAAVGASQCSLWRPVSIFGKEKTPDESLHGVEATRQDLQRLITENCERAVDEVEGFSGDPTLDAQMQEAADSIVHAGGIHCEALVTGGVFEARHQEAQEHLARRSASPSPPGGSSDEAAVLAFSILVPVVIVAAAGAASRFVWEKRAAFWIHHLRSLEAAGALAVVGDTPQLVRTFQRKTLQAWERMSGHQFESVRVAAEDYLNASTPVLNKHYQGLETTVDALEKWWPRDRWGALRPYLEDSAGLLAKTLPSGDFRQANTRVVGQHFARYAASPEYRLAVLASQGIKPGTLTAAAFDMYMGGGIGGVTRQDLQGTMDLVFSMKLGEEMPNLKRVQGWIGASALVLMALSVVLIQTLTPHSPPVRVCSGSGGSFPSFGVWAISGKRANGCSLAPPAPSVIRKGITKGAMPMSSRLTVVAGAAGSVGRCVVTTFARAGGPVVGLVRSESSQKDLERFLATQELPQPVSIRVGALNDGAAVEAMAAEVIREWGTPANLVNACGRFVWLPMAEARAEHMEDMWQGNLMTSWHLLQHFLPAMVKAGYGRCVFFSSRETQGIGSEGMAPYAASKAALDQLVRCTAREVRAAGVTANVLAPTIIDIASSRKSMPDADYSQWVKPEFLAAQALLLCQPDSQINGAIIPVAGQL